MSYDRRSSLPWQPSFLNPRALTSSSSLFLCSHRRADRNQFKFTSRALNYCRNDHHVVPGLGVLSFHLQGLVLPFSFLHPLLAETPEAPPPPPPPPVLHKPWENLPALLPPSSSPPLSSAPPRYAGIPPQILFELESPVGEADKTEDSSGRPPKLLF